MKIQLPSAVALLVVVSTGAWAAPAARQAPSRQTAPAQAPASAAADRESEIYFDLTMGHVSEQEYGSTNRVEDANRAIDFYKKAAALDPSSTVIGEHLAEMYFVSERTPEAIASAQDILRRDPTNLAARRLLARIYVRSLGDLSNASDQSSTIAQAIEQFREIIRLDPSDEDSAIWLARLYRLSNQHDQAEKVLRGVLTSDPDNEGAVGQLAQLLLDEDRSDEAIALLQQILERAPSAGLYQQMGDAYMQLHDADRAEEAYQHAVDLDPDQADHHQGLAEALFDSGKYQAALAEYQKLAQMEPEDPNNHLHLAEIYRQLHQLDKAEQEVLQAKLRAPGSLEVIYNEATIYEAEGRYEDAIRVLSDAVTAVKAQASADPSRRRTLAILYQLLGQLYRDEENYTAAISTFRQMVDLGPEEDRRARLLIIDAYRASHDLSHAFDEAQKALAAYPNDRNLRINQALLYGENNQPDQAAQSLRTLLDKSAADLEIDIDIAQVYEQCQRYADAEAAIRSAEKLVTRPADRETIGFSLGAVYEHQKKYDQAEQVFKGVLAINPRNAAVLNYYGYMLADRGLRLDEAVALVQRALTEDPGNASYLDSLGWAYYKQNKFAEAETYLRMALQGEAHNPTMLSHLGDVYAKTGRDDMAAAEWQKSLAEWQNALPSSRDPDKVTELQQKIANLKRRVAQQKPTESNTQ